MRTLSGHSLYEDRPPQGMRFSAGRIGRNMGLGLLRTVAGLVATLALLPVILLPLTTAVPKVLCLLLALVDVALLAFLVLSARIWMAKAAGIGGLLAVSILAVLVSHWFAATPPILGADGNPLPGSIAALEKVELNGSQQWITLRGKDINRPVLLFLAGGPGGSELAWTRAYAAALEDHFVVVNWDQRGTGKSYRAKDLADLSVDGYVADAHALVQMLRARFHQEKIYLVGESWGSILGVKLVQAYPELFHAFVGSGQMVNTVENDRMGYERALEFAESQGNTGALAAMRRNGPPPYFEGNLLMQYARYLNILNGYMAQRAPGDGVAYNQIVDVVRAPEYGLLDKVNWFRGLIDTFNVVYPQLVDLDFITQVPRLEVPVYFIVGRHDVNAMAALVERYYGVLDGPHKELIWFEKSGHAPMWEERGKFADVMVNRVLAQITHQQNFSPQELDTLAETEAFFDQLIPAQLRSYHIAGAAVAVVKEGQLHFAKGYGYADLVMQRSVVAERTLFRTDSTGKLFVWTAVMQLVEAGKLDLDTGVNTYLDFAIPATFPQPITLRHLLSHSAGFEDQGYMFAHNAAELEPPGLFLARHIPARVWPPGEVSGYSNYGTALAGYIVERVSGLPFEVYVEERIFAPLGMARSTFHQPLPATLADYVTQNYQYANGAFNLRPFMYLHVASAGEGHMTVTDMAQFMLAHLSAEETPILSQATVAQMHSRLFSHHPDINGFAHGFAEITLNHQRILRHEGNNPGVSSTALFLIPEQQVGVYVAYNSNGGTGPGDELRSAFLNHYYPALPEPFTAASLSNQQMAQLSGSYRTTRMFHTTFGKVTRLLGSVLGYGDIIVSSNDDGTFTTRGLGLSPRRWVAVAPDRLRLADGALDSFGDLLFAAGEEGEVTKLFVENNPYRAYEKVGWAESAPLHRLILALCVSVFVSLLLATLVAWLVQQGWPATKLMDANLLAWNLLLIACVLVLLFGAGFALTASESLIYGVTPGLLVVLALPLLALALAISSLVVTAMTWQSSHWGTLRLLHYGAGLMAMVVFAWWLHYWNLLGWCL